MQLCGRWIDEELPTIFEHIVQPVSHLTEEEELESYR